VRNYTESYGYDQVGNILQMVHDSGAAPTSWTRRYQIEPDPTDPTKPRSNRLVGTSLPSDGPSQYSAPYTYDAHGNMTSMPHLSTVTWNHRDEMANADLAGGGIVYFTYDAAGQRVRKVWEHNGTVEERIYLGGYEVYRKRAATAPTTATPDLERQTIQVLDGVRWIALVETTTADTSQGGAFQPSTVIRFQLGNHLGSAVLEVDDQGLVISYEEYHPYGTTAYHAGTGVAQVSLKRYRYTGKERDEETGLHYYGARYYASWLGRWTAADPKGMVDGPNLYGYVRGNPVRSSDPDGTESRTDGLIRQARAAARQRQEFDANRHAPGRLTPDEIGDVYKNAPQPDYAGPSTPEAAEAQQNAIHQGEAKRAAAKAEAAAHPSPTKGERWQVAKDAARNWALARATQLLSASHPLAPLVVPRLTRPLRAPEPTDNPTNYREWALRQEYDFAQGTLNTVELAASFVPVAEIANAGKLALGKLPMLNGIGMGGGGEIVTFSQQWAASGVATATAGEEGTVVLYHGSQNFKGSTFDLDVAMASKRAGTPQPGIYLTDDFKRAMSGYGRGGQVVRTEVPKSFAESVRQMGGPPGGKRPEFFVNTPEGTEVLNQRVRVLPTNEAFRQWIKGLF
jgi:RHS repeat-associated protein